MNNLCQTVTCFHTDRWEVSESFCVPHARCAPIGNSWACNCETGYVGDGTVSCEGTNGRFLMQN